ncbi:ImmA/IrrE family metallo-endopeptidase [Defluviimonas sp. SAOS-178_SWC]|uniref:ImmA/IrrE family metallo-endopeptidase n=1 Tax=Defluviimonas sp. SAOS-178_SWC TaxID=3121287 RepID=UPI0032216D5B
MADAIHRQLGPIDCAVPVGEIAYALDIGEVRREQLEGLEGMLLTNRSRSIGSILVNMSHGPRRARFSIAHELGHFLMERHLLSGEGGFRCTTTDMSEARDDTRHHKQEAEANLFAIALLAPAYRMRTCLGGDPDLRTLQKAADALDLSLEATIRRYLDLFDLPVAAIWTKGGKVRSAKRHPAFPWIPRGRGETLSDLTQAMRAIRNGTPGYTEMVDSPAAAWTDRDGVEIYEQTRVGRDGHAVTLLWADLPDDDDADEGGPAELGMPEFGRSRRRK